MHSEKVLFGILLPMTGKVYDFWVPRNMSMGGVCRLIAQAMEIIEPDFFLATDKTALMYMLTGQIQDSSITPQEAGFSNGDRFVLV